MEDWGHGSIVLIRLLDCVILSCLAVLLIIFIIECTTTSTP